MAAGKIFEVAFALNAVIGANFNATMMQAQNGMRTLGAGAQAANQSFAQMQTAAGTALSRLQGTEALAQRFAALKRSVTGTAADFEGAKQKAGQLAGEFNRSQAETERLRIALERAKQSAANMKATLTPATYRAMQTEIRGMADACGVAWETRRPTFVRGRSVLVGTTGLLLFALVLATHRRWGWEGE